MDGDMKWHNSPALGDWSASRVQAIIRCEIVLPEPVDKDPGNYRQIAVPCHGYRYLMTPWCCGLFSYGRYSSSWLKKCVCLPQVLGFLLWRSLGGIYICNMPGVNLGGPLVPSDLKHLLSKLNSSKIVSKDHGVKTELQSSICCSFFFCLSFCHFLNWFLNWMWHGLDVTCTGYDMVCLAGLSDFWVKMYVSGFIRDVFKSNIKLQVWNSLSFLQFYLTTNAFDDSFFQNNVFWLHEK